MRRILVISWITALAVAVGSVGLRADDDDSPASDDHEATAANKANGGTTKKDDSEKKFRDFAEVTKGADKIDGLFTLHHKDDHLYAEIKPNQFDQPLLAPIAIARGMAMAGQPLNFGDEWVLLFKRVGDRVQLIRRNIHYKAPARLAAGEGGQAELHRLDPDGPADRQHQQFRRPQRRDRPGRHLLHRLRRAGFGYLDRNRTNWHKIKAFPNNIELEVEATFGGGGLDDRRFGDDGVADRRGRTIVIHYSLAKLPDSSYKPRHADDRVGHFLSATKDFGSDNPDTNFVRQINRWRIEKADPKAKLSPPKKQLIWYVERHGPARVPAVRRGGHPRVEQGVREDRHPQRPGGPLAGGRARRLRPRGHQLLHLPLDHDQHDATRCRACGPTR